MDIPTSYQQILRVAEQHAVSTTDDKARELLCSLVDIIKQQHNTITVVHRELDRAFVPNDLRELHHEDNCRFWYDDFFCTCGAAEDARITAALSAITAV